MSVTLSGKGCALWCRVHNFMGILPRMSDRLKGFLTVTRLPNLHKSTSFRQLTASLPFLAATAFACAGLGGCASSHITAPKQASAQEAAQTSSQATSPEAIALPFDTAALDALLSNAVTSEDVVAASALVFDEGKIVYTGAFGLRDRERDQPMTRDTLVRVYSMTKPVTSAIILDLIEDGLLSLDTPVTDYIPELGQMQVMSADEEGDPVFTPQTAPMTIKDLLLHRSGIGYGIFGPINPVEAIYEKADLFNVEDNSATKMTKLSKLPLVAQPGTGWYYSLSTDVLGRVAEIVTGKKLGEIMDERIFTPFGMSETAFYVRADQQPRFASTYFKQEDGTFALAEDGQKSPFLNDPAHHSGGGGLVSTLDDYAKFSQMLLNGGIYNGHRFLDEETVTIMMSNRMDPDDLYLFPWIGGDTNNGFGYGGAVVIADTPEQIATNGQSVGHFGWNGAARTTFWIDQPNDAFAILFLQYFGGPEPELYKSFRVLVREQTKDVE